jgi:hypothetical protein
MVIFTKSTQAWSGVVEEAPCIITSDDVMQESGVFIHRRK